MELKVGMYVRTERIVTKIDKIDNYKTKWRFLVDKKVCNDGTFEYGALREEDILKASHNIIDLIEVGDYVNGLKVHFISKFEDNYYIKGEGANGFEIDFEHQKEIKSIVTKEQFESMSYKVEE